MVKEEEEGSTAPRVISVCFGLFFLITLMCVAQLPWRNLSPLSRLVWLFKSAGKRDILAIGPPDGWKLTQNKPVLLTLPGALRAVCMAA